MKYNLLLHSHRYCNTGNYFCQFVHEHFAFLEKVSELFRILKAEKRQKPIFFQEYRKKRGAANAPLQPKIVKDSAFYARR